MSKVRRRDLTSSFAALAAKCEERRNLNCDFGDDQGQDKDRILPRKKATKRGKSEEASAMSGFEARAKDILRSVDELKAFVLSNRELYVGPVCTGDGDLRKGMDDRQRDKIDANANKFMRTTNALIAKFRADLLGSSGSEFSAEQSEHLRAVGDILESYLRSICDLHSGQKAVRLEREIQFQNMSRLEINAAKNSGTESESFAERERRLRERLEAPSTTEGDQDDLEGEEEMQVSSKRRKSGRDNSDDGDDDNDDDVDSQGRLPTKPQQVPAAAALYSEDDDEDEEELSPDEVRLLEAENAELLAEFQTAKDSVKLIETKVVRIAELQDVFTKKVLAQKDDIDLIAATAVGATENIRDGNEELRKAIQNQASIRVYILFFLLMMSFSLLFLDWYND